MADECRQLEGFRAEEDGGRVEERLIEVPLGCKEGKGPFLSVQSRSRSSRAEKLIC